MQREKISSGESAAVGKELLPTILQIFVSSIDSIFLETEPPSNYDSISFLIERSS